MPFTDAQCRYLLDWLLRPIHAMDFTGSQHRDVASILRMISARPSGDFTKVEKVEIQKTLQRIFGAPSGPPISGPVQLRSPDWDTHIIRKYPGKYFFSIRSYDPRRAQQGGPPTADEILNDQRREQMENDYAAADFEVVPMSMPAGSTAQEFYNLWASSLKDRTGQDLIFVYYRGWTFGVGDGYSGYIEGVQEPVNLFKLFEAFNLTSDTDVCVFLDGPGHTRWTPALEPRDGMTEFIFNGAPVLNARLDIVDHPGDYFRSKFRILENTCGGPHEIGTTSSLSMQSIPELMKWDRIVHNNVERKWIDQTRKGSQNVIRRIVLDPVQMWVTGRIEFFGIEIQPEPLGRPGPALPVRQPEEDYGYLAYERSMSMSLSEGGWNRH